MLRVKEIQDQKIQAKKREFPHIYYNTILFLLCDVSLYKLQCFYKRYSPKKRDAGIKKNKSNPTTMYTKHTKPQILHPYDGSV